MARPRVNVEVQKSKSRMSKERVAKASAPSPRLGDGKPEMPPMVANEPTGQAANLWKHLETFIRDSDFITNAHTLALAQLCLLHAETMELRRERRTNALLSINDEMRYRTAIAKNVSLIKQYAESLLLTPSASLNKVAPSKFPPLTDARRQDMEANPKIYSTEELKHFKDKLNWAKVVKGNPILAFDDL